MGNGYTSANLHLCTTLVTDCCTTQVSRGLVRGLAISRRPTSTRAALRRGRTPLMIQWHCFQSCATLNMVFHPSRGRSQPGSCHRTRLQVRAEAACAPILDHGRPHLASMLAQALPEVSPTVGARLLAGSATGLRWCQPPPSPVEVHSASSPKSSSRSLSN